MMWCQGVPTHETEKPNQKWNNNESESGAEVIGRCLHQPIDAQNDSNSIALERHCGVVQKQDQHQARKKATHSSWWRRITHHRRLSCLHQSYYRLVLRRLWSSVRLLCYSSQNISTTLSAVRHRRQAVDQRPLIAESRRCCDGE